MDIKAPRVRLKKARPQRPGANEVIGLELGVREASVKVCGF